MSNTPVTRVAASPSESVLVTLARAAMATRTGEPAVWPTLDLSETGQRTFGDYELLEEIGRGGMGVVYRAHQCSLDREVAIKFIAAGIDDSLHVTRFLAEARSAARLVHPNIVPVYEVGSIDGLHYLSMPLMRGLSLADRLDKGPLTPEEALSLLLKLCDAIHYAHRLGLLHLDLKPANILIDEHQQPLVADFGLARHMDGQGGVDAQEVSGTPQYMAPEQILIKQYRLTHATDLYALGALLYRVLTGVSPHGEGQSDDVIRRAVAGRIRPPRDLMASLGRDLDAVCMKCLELQPSDRYASVAALADDLRRVRDGLPVSVRSLGLLESFRRWSGQEPILPVFKGLLLFVIATLVLAFVGISWILNGGLGADSYSATVSFFNFNNTRGRFFVGLVAIAAVLGAWGCGSLIRWRRKFRSPPLFRND
jgi:serine/threonine protein kinase